MPQACPPFPQKRSLGSIHLTRGAGVLLLNLKPRQCRFILGDGSPARFCAEPTISGESWCHEHYRLVYASSPTRWKADLTPIREAVAAAKPEMTGTSSGGRYPLQPFVLSAQDVGSLP